MGIKIHFHGFGREIDFAFPDKSEKEYFVNILKTSDKRYDIYKAMIVLRDCGQWILFL